MPKWGSLKAADGSLHIQKGHDNPCSPLISWVLGAFLTAFFIIHGPSIIQRPKSHKAYHLEPSMPSPPWKYRVYPQLPAVLYKYTLHSNDTFLSLEAPMNSPRTPA